MLQHALSHGYRGIPAEALIARSVAEVAKQFWTLAWYIGAWADELGDKPLPRRICGDPVVLFRDDSGKAAALADRCCHRAAPLHLGSLVEVGFSAAITASFSARRDAVSRSPGKN